ncbi:adenovirus e3 region CR2 domain-containing protein [Fusarium coicis]|nr:adenovirus e3 region CR2 domain-containing protein [Fusarium coicis]
MRFSTAILFAGNALAAVQQECLANHHEDLAAFADCANKGALSYCLANLKETDEAALKNCYTSAGCSSDAAAKEAHYTFERCSEIAKAGELKKRYEAAPIPAIIPRVEAAAAITDGPKATGELKKRAADTSRGTDCYTTFKKSTEQCDLETVSDKTRTATCYSTEISTSSCRDEVLCTTDASSDDICMTKKEMDTAGIIIAIVFAASAALMLGYLTFMCCRDRKEQKRLVAKSEAVALARAATKKQRAAQRQPLIRNASGQSAPGAGNPFQDRI